MKDDILYASSHTTSQENTKLKTTTAATKQWCLMGLEVSKDWLNWGKVRLLRII